MLVYQRVASHRMTGMVGVMVYPEQRYIPNYGWDPMGFQEGLSR